MNESHERKKPRDKGKQQEKATPREKNNDLFVVAIDFGTSYTGYAYAQRDSYETDPLRIYGMKIDNNQQLGKVPTSILLTPDDSFHSFGKTAEDTYGEKCSNGERDWKLFKNFKMTLYNASDKKTTRDLVIEDCRGNTISAITLFTLMFSHLKSAFVKQLEEATKGVPDDWIRWVITVPAIWDDSAKQFIREAAEKAGIRKIILALEPECAALYCGTLLQGLRDTLKNQALRIVGPGSRYILLDMGGGTVDITAHEVSRDFTYDELFAANGGPWGGENVNIAFQEYLCEIFTKPVFSEFCKVHTEDFYDLMGAFEQKKRTFEARMVQENKFVVIKLPYYLGKDFPLNTPMDLAVKEHDKLKIPAKHMMGFFNGTLDEISRHIKNKLKTEELKDINNVILVGGFSVPNIVKDRLKEVFPENANFYCPENSEVATLEGAVLYGQSQIHTTYEKSKPRSITPSINSRRSRFTYGMDSHVQFNPTKHPESKKFRDGDEVFCKDYFWVLLRAGAKLSRDKKGTMRTFTMDKDSTTLDVVIYKTENPSPKFVDDPGCLRLGTLVVDMTEGLGIPNREIKIGLQYNDTELNVYAINNIDKTVKTTFDLLA